MGESRYEYAMLLIREAAKMTSLKHGFEIAYQRKNGHQDIVSQFDKKIEQFITDRIRERFPLDGVVGEETACSSHGEWNWYIDPIDGTSNFVNQHKNYAISIGCYHCGAPEFGLVLDVEANHLFHARIGGGAFCNGERLPAGANREDVSEMFLYTPIFQPAFLAEHPKRPGMLRLAGDVRAIRSLGSVALELCALATREVDLFIAARSSPWDHNAARIILAETGGEIRTWEGEPVPVEQHGSIIGATSGKLLERIMREYMAFSEA